MPVLSVKFKIPEPRRNYILRKKLSQRLMGMLEHKVTIVKGGAGSGKTTLLSILIKEKNLKNVKWISLDENMNNLFVFWKYVLEATRVFFEEEEESFQSCFDGNIQQELMWQMIALIVNKLEQQETFFLVLDDFQHIKDQQLIATLNFFIANMPSNMHLVLLCRQLPDIYLGTLSLENELLLIEAEELRMTDEESADFLRNTLEFSEDKEEFANIIKGCNGWVGGLQLMAIAAKNQISTEMLYINASMKVIYDYMSKEIFSYLQKDEKEFLKRTALLPYFNKSICERYVPQYDFETMMASILNKNLFVISIDGEKQEYRYHAILKDYLMELFEDKEKRNALYNKSATVYYELGDYDESIGQLFAAGAYERIMDQLMTMPQNAVTFSYMMQVPMKYIIKNVDFAYQYLFCYYANSDIMQCQRIYEYIIECMKDANVRTAFESFKLLFDTKFKIQSNDYVALEQIEKLPLNEVTKACIIIKEANILHFISNQSETALFYLKQAENIYEKTQNNYIHAFVLVTRTQILEDCGELVQALQYYKKLEKYLEKMPMLKITYYLGRAGVYTKQLDVVSAQETLAMTRKLADKRLGNAYYAYLYTLTELSYALGEDEKAEEVFKEIQMTEVFKNLSLSARLIRFIIFKGNHEELGIKYREDYEQTESLIKNMDTDLLYMDILYHQGEYLQAIEGNKQLVTMARKVHNKLKLVEGNLQRVRFLLEQSGEKCGLVDAFIEAMVYAYEQRMVLPIWFEKKTIKRVMEIEKKVLRQRLGEEIYTFIKQNLELQKMQDLASSNLKDLYDLTDREQEVLDEMKQGFTNKEIAVRLCISLATVKTHIINIYSKLGVKNRVEAVNKMMYE